MKPTLFVGSSKEALPIAEAVQSVLQNTVDVTLWNQGIFHLSRTTLDSLLKTSRAHDYAVFVFAPDDVILLRNEIQLITRDNVMFELGMFISALGPERCFFLVPSNVGEFRIPTDLAGITPARYDPTSHLGNLRAAVGAACTDIADAIRQNHRLSGEWLMYISDSQHEDPNGVMFITCAGQRAIARLELRKAVDGRPVSRDFNYEGRYVAGQFALTFEQGGAGDQIVGTMVLRLRADRSIMDGQSTFWHHDRAKMATSAFILRRP